MKSRVTKTNIIYLLMLIVCISLDQITKRIAFLSLKPKGSIELIPGVFGFTYVENSGAAWGILNGRIWLFALITCLVVAVVVYAYIRMPFEPKYTILRFTLVLLIAGALGNFIDRMKNHFVIDFFQAQFIDFPVFNVADIFVCVSAFLLIFCLIFKYKEEDLKWK